MARLAETCGDVRALVDRSRRLALDERSYVPTGCLVAVSRPGTPNGPILQSGGFPDREKPRVCNAYNTSPDLNNGWGDHGFTALSVRNDACADLPSSCGIYHLRGLPAATSNHSTHPTQQLQAPDSNS